MKRTFAINDKKIDIDSDASTEEIVARVKEEGIDLTDEQLEQVSGGSWDAKTMPSEITEWIECPNCNGLVVDITQEHHNQGYVDCPGCGTRYML